MPVILYRGKHKKKLRKLAPVTQASSTDWYSLKRKQIGRKLKNACTGMARSCLYAVVSHLLLALVPLHRYNTESCTYGSGTPQRRDTGQNDCPHTAIYHNRSQRSGKTPSSEFQQWTDCRPRRISDELEKQALRGLRTGKNTFDKGSTPICP